MCMRRGQGDVMGKRQSGKDALSWFKAAQLPGDRGLLETARALASELVAQYTVQI